MAKKNEKKRRPADRRLQEKRYTEKTLREDREYGLYWYAWLWKVIRPVMVLLCSLIIVCGLVSMGWNKVYGEFLSPVDETAQQTSEFVIESGSSVSTIGSHLYEQGYLRNKGIFKYIIQFRGLTNSIQYGSYQLSPAMNVMEIIEVLSSGSVTTERTITIIPGWSVEDIAAYLVEIGALEDEREFLELCNRPGEFIDGSYALQMADEAGFEGRLYALEGYLAPDTYQVFLNADAEDIIEKLLGQTDKVIDRLIYSQEEAQIAYDENGNIIEVVDETPKYETKLDQEQTLVLASIIEREAGKKEDYAKVSAVFHNRLNNGIKLESDATITYALGIDQLALSGTELSLDSPYNSYTHGGLPPGPICNPSAAAIEAALYPDLAYLEQGYMYFCSKEPESGELAFAITLEEHERNVEKYRPSWIEYDRLRALEAQG
ncbi:MAG: endolytic transglycosylase MltG [Eubacteriales bacterium]|nr:endolytic transglycosylase MltG [Eubacteriales bacterium]